MILADVFVGVVLLGCGGIAWVRVPGSRTGPLMVLTGLAWLVGTIWPIAVFWHRGPLVHVHLSYPTGRLRRRLATVAVAAAYVDAVRQQVALNDVVTLTLAGIVTVAAIDSFARSSGRAHRADRSALGAAVAYSAALGGAALNRMAGWADGDAVTLAYDAIVAGAVVVLLVELLWGRWTEAAIADLVVGLGERGDLDTLREHLARALGDPSLVVGYWLPEQGTYVDDLGRPIELPRDAPMRSVTRVDDGDQPVAVLIHDTATIDDPRLVASVAAAARLAVVNARLQVEARVRLDELAASRRRVVESSDEERRRVERELAGGPARHLDSAARLLDEAGREASGAEGSELAALAAELRSVRIEVHEVVQGMRPSVLADGGLAAALPVLAARTPVPVDLAVGVGRLSPVVEAAVYFVCAEALTNVAKHAGASRVSVSVVAAASTVIARIADDGAGGADPSRGSGLRGLADRVEALDGRFAVEAGTHGGTAVIAEVPVDGGSPATAARTSHR